MGQVIDRYLQGSYDIDPEVRALLYAADRYQFMRDFQDFLDDGGVLVADRYSQSNLAFQTTAFEGEDWREVVDWMDTVESRLPDPDVVIFLDIPPEKARELMEDEGKDQDVHEEDLEFQHRVLERYGRLAGERGWEVVEVVEEGEIRPKEDIAAEIREIVEEQL